MSRLGAECSIFVDDLWHSHQAWPLQSTINCVLLRVGYAFPTDILNMPVCGKPFVGIWSFIFCRVQVYHFFTCSKQKGIKEQKIFWGWEKGVPTGKTQWSYFIFLSHHAAKCLALGRHRPVFTKCIDGWIDRQTDI